MPFSDRPPSSVFPDTDFGRRLHNEFVAEDFEVLNGTACLCGEYEPTQYPIHTDDDLYRNRSLRACSRRKRDGVRDMNWCLRCPVGFPHAWLSARDAERLSDFASTTGF